MLPFAAGLNSGEIKIARQQTKGVVTTWFKQILTFYLWPPSELIHLSDEKASGFYAEHIGKSFFEDLKKFMTSGPVFVQVLEGENAVQKNRDLMGSTDPMEANPGTIRSDFAKSIDANAVHGSDSLESAKREIEYFFDEKEILNK